MFSVFVKFYIRPGTKKIDIFFGIYVRLRVGKLLRENDWRSRTLWGSGSRSFLNRGPLQDII